MSYFDALDVPLGPSTYAEPFAADTFLKMPANALVNVGYLVVGGYWLWRSPGLRDRADRGYFQAFALLALLYGPLQFTRIVTQERWIAILDQWLTLPFFGLVIAWALALRGVRVNAALIVAASAGSYLVAPFLPRGFELLLALHIACAVAVTVPLVRSETWAPFAAAILCCAMFVGLKKADFVLAEVGLTRFTGHFWSKVGDFLQIHFVASFFLRSTSVAAVRSHIARTIR